MNDNQEITKIPDIKKSLFSGLLLRCPQCHKGRIFKSYLKQNTSCSSCHENFSGISPDDGPAWITIFLAGHIVVPLVLYLERLKTIPYWQEIIYVLIVAIVSILLLLPRSKGVFFAILWHLKKKNALEDSKISDPEITDEKISLEAKNIT